MRRTSGNISLNVLCRYELVEIRNKFQQLLDANDMKEEIIITSNNSNPDDEEFLYLNVESVALRLKYELEKPVSIYAIIQHFPDAKVQKQYAEIIYFTDKEEFFKKTEDIKEMGNMIGDTIYNVISDPVRSLLEIGISLKPLEE